MAICLECGFVFVKSRQKISASLSHICLVAVRVGQFVHCLYLSVLSVICLLCTSNP